MNKYGVAKFLEWSGALGAIMTVRRMLHIPWLPILTYHRVANIDAATNPFGDVVDATPEQFEKQVAFLGEHFEFISVRDLLAYYRGGRLPPNPVMLTFDDGYRECHQEVLPVLLRHGACATFFVPTTYLESRRIFWWDRISLLVDRGTREVLELEYPFTMRLPLVEEKRSAVCALIGVVKTYMELDLDRFLDHVAEALGVDLARDEERKLADELLMTWDQVRALEKWGMQVESHTRTHRVMNTLSPQQVCEELVGSRVDLEVQLGRRICALAYPVGYPVRQLPHVREALRTAGYELAFTNQTGVNHTLLRGDCFDVHRIAMNRQYDDMYFRAMLAVPYLAPSRVMPRPYFKQRPTPVPVVATPRPAEPRSRATDARPTATPTLNM